MSRIRTIKPEFTQSETIGRLSRDARLLFIQIWTLVDDSGKARASSRDLASDLYPFDDDVKELIDGWLCELCDEGLITLYVVDGSTYLIVNNWLKHQKIDRPSNSKLPDFDEASTKPRRSLAAGPRTKDTDAVTDTTVSESSQNLVLDTDVLPISKKSKSASTKRVIHR